MMIRSRNRHWRLVCKARIRNILVFNGGCPDAFLRQGIRFIFQALLVAASGDSAFKVFRLTRYSYRVKAVGIREDGRLGVERVFRGLNAET